MLDTLPSKWDPGVQIEGCTVPLRGITTKPYNGGFEKVGLRSVIIGDLVEVFRIFTKGPGSNTIYTKNKENTGSEPLDVFVHGKAGRFSYRRRCTPLGAGVACWQDNRKNIGRIWPCLERGANESAFLSALVLASMIIGTLSRLNIHIRDRQIFKEVSEKLGQLEDIDFLGA